METRLSSAQWMIVGFEEFVLGYNQLLRGRLFHFTDLYVDTLKKIAEELKTADDKVPQPVIVNKWHWAGVDDAIDYHYDERTEQEKQKPLASFLNYPLGIKWNKRGFCDYCGSVTDRQYAFIDALQDHAFCCLEHGYAHRRSLATMIPQVAALYSQPPVYTFKPLPYKRDDLVAYLRSLPPSILDPVLDTPEQLDWKKYKPTPPDMPRIRKKRD